MDSIPHRWVWRMLAAALVVAAVCARPAPVSAQAASLADLARQEAERRKAIRVPSKVVTEKDLKPAPPGLVPPASASGTATATPAPVSEEAPAPKNPAGGEPRDQAWWKARAEQLREDLRRSELFAETLQTKVNSLSSEFVSRDDPYQRAKIGGERQSMLAEMDRVKGDVERFKKAIADLEEDARRAGVPPGWLR